MTGLALVARHPGRVGTFVAHELPLLELLPDAAEQRAKTDDVVETFHTQGIGAAWMKFMANAGFAVGGDIAPAIPRASRRRRSCPTALTSSIITFVPPRGSFPTSRR